MHKINFTPYTPQFKQNPKKVVKEEPNSDFQLDKKYTDKAIRAGIIASVCLGMGTAKIYNDYQTKALIKDMMEECNYSDNKSLRIEDLNGDDTPEIILEKKDGANCVYDFKNNKVYYDFGDEQIEKLR